MIRINDLTARAISARLREVLQMRKMTQEELAKESRLPVGIVKNMVEQGQIFAPYLIKVANALDVDVEWLIVGKGPDMYKIGKTNQMCKNNMQPVVDTIKEVTNDICKNYCKYYETRNEKDQCLPMQTEIGCPLNRLY